MKILTAILTLLSIHCFAVPTRYMLPPEPKNTEPMTRVLIAKNVPGALLEANGSYEVLREGTRVVLSSGSTGKRFVVQSIENGLRWGEEYPDEYQITLVPKSPKSRLFVDGIQYSGVITIYYANEGGISIVNELPTEEYLKATLSAEFETPLSKEAMASYAIAARTSAYSKAKQASEQKQLYDVVADESKYYGSGVTRQKNGVEEAVGFTKHIVLMQGGTPASHIALTKEDAEKKSQRGYDAKKILKEACPTGELVLTTGLSEGAIR